MSDSARVYPPTQQHLRRLRERGLSARSTSFIQAVGFVFATAGAYVCWASVARYMKEALREAVKSTHEKAAGRGNILDACWAAAGVFSRASLIVGLAAGVGCCAAALLHFKPQLTAHLAAPSLDRINPFKRAQATLLASRSYRGVALNLICSFCMALGLWYAVGDEVMQLWVAGPYDISVTENACAAVLTRGLVAIAACVLTFGVIDVLLQKHDFARQSRMTYNEKIEDDRMQEQPASLAQELKVVADSLEGGLGRVREAAVLARNPTHLVVGLAYNAHLDEPAGRAPRIVCKGSGRYAFQIMDRAAFYGIPVQTNIPLARGLFTLPIDSEIPAELYAAVDALLAEVGPRRRTSSSQSSTRDRRGLYTVLDAVLRQLTKGVDNRPVGGVFDLLARILRVRTR